MGAEGTVLRRAAAVVHRAAAAIGIEVRARVGAERVAPIATAAETAGVRDGEVVAGVKSAAVSESAIGNAIGTETETESAKKTKTKTETEKRSAIETKTESGKRSAIGTETAKKSAKKTKTEAEIGSEMTMGHARSRPAIRARQKRNRRNLHRLPREIHLLIRQSRLFGILLPPIRACLFRKP